MMECCHHRRCRLREGLPGVDDPCVTDHEEEGGLMWEDEGRVLEARWAFFPNGSVLTE